MRVAFMGTPLFAVPSLEALARNHTVVAVYTRPDAVSGRGGSTKPSPVKEAAARLGLEVRTPATLRNAVEVDSLRRLAPEVGVAAAYGLILPPEILTVAKYGFVNVHASLLPRWRGAAPIERAILAGDEVTGVSIMQMEPGLDTGPYCERAETPIDDKTAGELADELAQLGAEALVRALVKIDGGGCIWRAQDDAEAVYADKVAKDDVRLTPDLDSVTFLRRVRASGRHAPARLRLGGRVLTIARAAPSDASIRPGSACRDGDRLVVGSWEGAVELLRVKPEGRNEMDVADWLRGAGLEPETLWDSAP